MVDANHWNEPPNHDVLFWFLGLLLTLVIILKGVMVAEWILT